MNLRAFPTMCLIAILGIATLLSGCQHVNVAQITYEVLRTEDCRRNKLDDFCARTYASDYYDYVRVRKEFLRSQQPTTRQTGTNEVILQEVPNSL